MKIDGAVQKSKDDDEWQYQYFNSRLLTVSRVNSVYQKGIATYDDIGSFNVRTNLVLIT